GPRKDLPDVRLALSKEALKINGSPSRAARSRSVSAMRSVRSCDSMTQGPRIQTSGRPGPQTTSPMATGSTVGTRGPPWLGTGSGCPGQGGSSRARPTGSGQHPPVGLARLDPPYAATPHRINRAGYQSSLLQLDRKFIDFRGQDEVILG